MSDAAFLARLDADFLTRLAAAVQHHHESNLQLERLATELIDHISRMRSFTDKLQSHLVAPETPARARQDVVAPEAPVAYAFSSEPMALPHALKGGPIRGER
jgi:hypothetical protein